MEIKAACSKTPSLQNEVLFSHLESNPQQRSQWSAILEEPNCKLFYQSVQIELEDIFISAKAAAGGFTEMASGRISKINALLETLCQFFSFTPWVGAVFGNLLEEVFKKAIKKIDQRQQTYIISHLAKIGSMQVLCTLARNIARQLTYWYAPQLRLLPESPSLFLRLTPQKGAKYCLSENKLAPTQRFVALVMLWLLEGLKTLPLISTLPVSTQLVQFITVQKSLPTFGTSSLTLQQLRKSVQQCQREFNHLLSNIFIDTETHSGLFLPDFFTRSGIETADGKRYGGNGTDPRVYGYCYGNMQAVKLRGLHLVEDTKSICPHVAPAPVLL